MGLSGNFYQSSVTLNRPTRESRACYPWNRGPRMDTYDDIAKMIDHSLLHPTLTADDLEKGIRLALDYNTASVCILPYYLKRCAHALAGTTVRAGTTIGFPHGGHATAVKVAEARQALADGGEELDMVVNISGVLGGDWKYVRDDIAAVIDVTHAAGRKVKVIFENCYLNDAQKIRLCEICSELNADWVKTSTGYGSGGATLEDLALMRKHAAPHVQVKAAGGVRDLDTLLRVRALGVTRAGATRTAAILEEHRRRLGLPAIGTEPGAARPAAR
jgi:deoxyribose-phosphate aldolase